MPCHCSDRSMGPRVPPAVGSCSDAVGISKGMGSHVNPVSHNFRSLPNLELSCCGCALICKEDSHGDDKRSPDGHLVLINYYP